MTQSGIEPIIFPASSAGFCWYRLQVISAGPSAWIVFLFKKFWSDTFSGQWLSLLWRPAIYHLPSATSFFFVESMCGVAGHLEQRNTKAGELIFEVIFMLRFHYGAGNVVTSVPFLYCAQQRNGMSLPTGISFRFCLPKSNHLFLWRRVCFESIVLVKPYESN